VVVSQSKQDDRAGVQARWSPWTPLRRLEHATPLFARLSGQTEQEVAQSFRHLERLALMEIRRGRGEQRQFRVRVDRAASIMALLNDAVQERKN
jgi:hypothetical protein